MVRRTLKIHFLMKKNVEQMYPSVCQPAHTAHESKGMQILHLYIIYIISKKNVLKKKNPDQKLYVLHNQLYQNMVYQKSLKRRK